MRPPRREISRQRALFSSRMSFRRRATSPGSSTLGVTSDIVPRGLSGTHRPRSRGSGSSALRLMASKRSGRARRNLGWLNSQVWDVVDVRWARGVCLMGCQVVKWLNRGTDSVNFMKTIHVELTDKA